MSEEKQDLLKLDEMSNSDLLKLYPALIREYRRRKLINSVRILPEISEALIIDFYNSTDGLPNLNIVNLTKRDLSYDAEDESGKRYEIKMTSSHMLSRFVLPENNQLTFDVLIVGVFDKNHEILEIMEIKAEDFLVLIENEAKTIQSIKNTKTVRLSLTKEFRNYAKLIYSK